jgi:hypothetical protein
MATWDDSTTTGRTGAELEGVYLASFAQSGVLSTTTGTFRFRFPADAFLIGASAAVAVAPTGASLIVDVHKNGTTIYTTQANRPTIAASGFAASETAPDVTTITTGDYLTVDIDQVGSSVTGEDLTVFVRYVWAP